MNREEERKRLINILGKCSSESRCERHGNPFGDDYCKECKYENENSCEDAYRADYLLDKGAIIPPCNIGDTVYQIKGTGIKKYKVDYLDIFKNSVNFTFKIHLIADNWSDFVFDNDFGETVFLTKEEAEKHL